MLKKTKTKQNNNKQKQKNKKQKTKQKTNKQTNKQKNPRNIVLYIYLEKTLSWYFPVIFLYRVKQELQNKYFQYRNWWNNNTRVLCNHGFRLYHSRKIDNTMHRFQIKQESIDLFDNRDTSTTPASKSYNNWSTGQWSLPYSHYTSHKYLHSCY